MNFSDIDEYDGENKIIDANMVNPDLIGFGFISNGDSKHISDFLAIVESLLSSQLNDAQKHFFSLIIKYVMKLKSVFKNSGRTRTVHI